VHDDGAAIACDHHHHEVECHSDHDGNRGQSTPSTRLLPGRTKFFTKTLVIGG